MKHEALLRHIRRYVELNEEEQDLIGVYSSIQEFRKKDFLLHLDQICSAHFFVAKGCLRAFLINEKGQEQITQFAIENWWITNYDSLDNQIPSSLAIQAVENTEVIRIHKNDYEMLLHKIPKLERYFRLVLQKAYGASQRRIQYIYTLSGEERYHHFNESFPEFVQRIPQYMLASYLGFTPEFLSKIRAKKI
ncbi:MULTISPECIES: Crp/Fnr family transcriptional regulator [Xanthocytophaga]|uniref:Crp/Fnr family transcriptional regulator n=2 Tax=Xanthocytophaga TaxID=3078918 RepID=A0AAE3QSJ7_9BACT|nr:MULTISPECIES: Crp/Fnr family transcriptional regulator [Xanthocytophaga]MDJ1484545.1 Crp/Fnr family transcriptional regulator [Xanthocytophaga flavus]MDJ1499117.1 Crp/Fnr family transcriptional regulator [Xanthocytophaga agilis]